MELVSSTCSDADSLTHANDEFTFLDVNTWFDVFFDLVADLPRVPAALLIKRTWFLLLLAPHPLRVFVPDITEAELEKLIDDGAHLQAALALFSSGDAPNLQRAGARSSYRATITFPGLNFEGQAKSYDPAVAILSAWCDAILVGLLGADAFAGGAETEADMPCVASRERPNALVRTAPHGMSRTGASRRRRRSQWR